MDSISVDAAKHLTTVLELFALFLTGLGVILGAFWAGFMWLRKQIREEFSTATNSEEFWKKMESHFTPVIQSAASGWNEINNRLHNEHTSRIDALYKRDEERARAVTQLHRRVDRAWEELAGKGTKT